MDKTEFPIIQVMLVMIITISVLWYGLNRLTTPVSKLPVFEEKQSKNNCWIYVSDVVRTPVIGCD